MLKKTSDYRDAGIPHIWLADPYQRAVFQAGEAGIREVAGGILETDLAGAIDFRALFAELDEPAGCNQDAGSCNSRIQILR
jgi:Uma2 family endonuclease